jgi:hypothetical protein
VENGEGEYADDFPSLRDEGWADTLHDAIEKEWTKKGKHDGDEHQMQVTAIYVKGKNPISGYRVILRD